MTDDAEADHVGQYPGVRVEVKAMRGDTRLPRLGTEQSAHTLRRVQQEEAKMAQFSDRNEEIDEEQELVTDDHRSAPAERPAVEPEAPDEQLPLEESRALQDSDQVGVTATPEERRPDLFDDHGRISPEEDTA